MDVRLLNRRSCIACHNDNKNRCHNDISYDYNLPFVQQQSCNEDNVSMQNSQLIVTVQDPLCFDHKAGAPGIARKCIRYAMTLGIAYKC